MILGMNHETVKWKVFLFLLKDQFCFAFFPLSKFIDLHNEVLNFAQKERDSLGV
jgi:hypothetical protein